MVPVTEVPRRPGNLRSLWRFTRWLAALDPWRLAVIVGLLALQSLTPAFNVWVIQSVFRAAQALYTGAGSLATLERWLVVWAVLLCFSDGFVYPMRNWLIERARHELELSLHERLQSKAGRLRLEAFERSDFYDVLNRARQAADPGRFANLIWECWAVAEGVISTLAVAAVVAAQSPVLLGALVLAAAPGPFVQFLQAKADYWFNRSQDDRRRLRDYLATLLRSREAAKEVRVFGWTEPLTAWWARLHEAIAAQAFIYERKRQATRTGFASLGALGLTLGVGYSAWAVAAGAFDAAGFAGMLVALIAVQNGIGYVSNRLGYITGEYLINLADLFVYLDLEPEEPAGGEAPGDLARADVVLEGVSFRYPQSEQEALSGVTTTIRAGERIALVGENGSGKSTLVKVLTGLYRPTAGCVRWGGRDLAALNLAEMRRQTAAVFQDYTRFAFSLHDNIGYGRPERLEDRRAVEQAAAKGGADAVAAGLPQSYETLLTREFSGGTELSGGQWQRIAISRGFMREAPVVVLDEPTASLDPQAEAEVFRRFAALAGRRTAILVSHRLGSARLCDRVLVLKAGRLVETGSHQELLAKGGEYARMWALQAAWYEDAERAQG